MNDNPASDLDGYRKLFIVGCPRSGTTWVQLLLSHHSKIATAPETQIFAYYLVNFERQWRNEQNASSRYNRGKAGLSRLLDQNEFDRLCTLCATFVLDKIAERNPGADVVAEKSPRHAIHAEFIHRLFPNAYFLHIVRDPRDTVASLLAAGRGWGSDWAPANAIDAARMWLRHTESANQISQFANNVMEVKYEALKANAPAELHKIFLWLDLRADPAFCSDAAAKCDFQRLQNSADGEGTPLPSLRSPKEFFRKGEVGAWRKDLSRPEIRIVEHICALMMAEYSYPPLITHPSRPKRIGIHDAIRRVRESADWQLSKLLRKV